MSKELLKLYKEVPDEDKAKEHVWERLNGRLQEIAHGSAENTGIVQVDRTDVIVERAVYDSEDRMGRPMYVTEEKEWKVWSPVTAGVYDRPLDAIKYLEPSDIATLMVKHDLMNDNRQQIEEALKVKTVSSLAGGTECVGWSSQGMDEGLRREILGLLSDVISTILMGDGATEKTEGEMREDTVRSVSDHKLIADGSGDEAEVELYGEIFKSSPALASTGDEFKDNKENDMGWTEVKAEDV